MRFNDLTAEWRQYEDLFGRQEAGPKTVLLREGEVSRRAFFIKKGCLRMWFNNEGKDTTAQLFFEQEWVCSIESFHTGEPSLFSLETIEPCMVKTLSREHFLRVMSESAVIRKAFEEQVLQRMIYYQKLFLSRIKNSPEKRYQDLLKNHPEVLQRVPQHYIASYLGITPVSLSRIRNRRPH